MLRDIITGFNGAETNCRIVHNLGILLMNSNCFAIIFSSIQVMSVQISVVNWILFKKKRVNQSINLKNNNDDKKDNLNVHLPCLRGLHGFFNGYLLLSLILCQITINLQRCLNHYPRLGTKSSKAYPFSVAPQQLYLCISSPCYHHCISLHGQTITICLF